jgi:hypothetical protein
LSAELKGLVQEASAAYGAGDYEVAVDKLLAAYRIEPNARLIYNTARSYDQLGQCRRALVYYRAFSQHKGAEKSLVSNAKKKLAKAAECDTYDPSLGGRLSVFSQPDGATITVDGRQVGTTPTEVAGLTSGEHRIAVELDGYKVVSKTLTLEAAQDRKVRAVLVEAPDSEPISPKEVSQGAGAGENVSTDSGDTGVNIPAVALVGAGVLGLGVGAYFDLIAIPATDDERSGFEPNSPQYAELTDTRSSQATGALVGYIGGGALLAAGATWLLLDSSWASSEHEASALRPIASPNEGGFVAGLEWQF